MNKTKLIKSLKTDQVVLSAIGGPQHESIIQGIDWAINVIKNHADWISVEDEMPSVNMILTHHADGSIRVTDLLGDEYKHAITHWQHLPPPPKEIEE